MSKVLITGGCGYIGSHTIVDLIEKGYDIICVDNLSRSDGSLLYGIEEITGKKVEFIKLDISDKESFNNNLLENVDSIIHFASFKSVNESVQNPLLYFRNNINSLINLLEASQKFNIKNFIFSSSCSVYGDIKNSLYSPFSGRDVMSILENTQLNNPKSPYARSKQMCESIIEDMSKISKINFLILRYFNPIGAHNSGLIGEIPFGEATNLIPAMIKCSKDKSEFVIYGNDYLTRDGTCIRDYIHVMDIAEAHTLSLKYLEEGKQNSNYEVYNLGSGNGISVKEMVDSFERVSNLKLNYKYGPRREGDIASIYANSKLIGKRMGWTPKRNIDEMIKSALKWKQN